MCPIASGEKIKIFRFFNFSLLFHSSTINTENALNWVLFRNFVYFFFHFNPYPTKKHKMTLLQWKSIRSIFFILFLLAVLFFDLLQKIFFVSELHFYCHLKNYHFEPVLLSTFFLLLFSINKYFERFSLAKRQHKIAQKNIIFPVCRFLLPKHHSIPSLFHFLHFIFSFCFNCIYSLINSSSSSSLFFILYKNYEKKTFFTFP